MSKPKAIRERRNRKTKKLICCNKTMLVDKYDNATVYFCSICDNEIIDWLSKEDEEKRRFKFTMEIHIPSLKKW